MFLMYSLQVFIAVVDNEEDDYEPVQGPNENFGHAVCWQLRILESEPVLVKYLGDTNFLHCSLIVIISLFTDIIKMH